MKIINLTSENVKRLKAVSITPKGNMVEITGKNGAGKSSVLDSIFWAFTGASNIQAEPIRKGQDKAFCKLSIGEKEIEYIVTRTFARKAEGGHTTSVFIESPDGARFQKPQTMIDNLLGALAMDPLEFSRMPAEQQFSTMAAFVKGYDFAHEAGLDKADYDKRTEVNRRAREALAQAGAIQLPEGVPTEKVDESAIITELGEVGEFNATIERRRERREQTAKDAAAERAQAAEKRVTVIRMKATIGILEAEAEEHDVLAAEMEATISSAEPLPEPKDPVMVRVKLDAAKATNANVDRANRRAQHIKDAADRKSESDALTARMAAREKAKQAAIAAAKMPVPGIEFGDGHIRLNGVPFDQASDAERLRTSMAIAMASNPKLRLIRVRDGSLLDDDAMRIIGEMADSADYQCWIERVDGTGKVGFFMDDGLLKGEPTEKGALL